MSLTSKVVSIHALFPSWSSTKIAKELGCSAEYVRAVAQRKGLRLPRSILKLTPRQQAEIAAATETKTRVLSQRYGVSYSCIYALQKRGDAATPPKVFDDREAREVALARRDLTAQLMGDPPPRV